MGKNRFINNPFKYGIVVTGDNFCNRTREVTELKNFNELPRGPEEFFRLN